MVYILLSTYNGAKHLQELLNSLSNQEFDGKFILVARDDGSSDNSYEILKAFASSHKINMTVLDSNTNLGIKKSFEMLMRNALERGAKYIMFCDQDDIWLPNKVAETMRVMLENEAKYENLPILVHSDLMVSSENLAVLDDSFWHYENIDPSKNTFNRLLLQNTITGCTVAINRSLAEISIPIPDEAIMHDWWIGLLASKFGKIFYIDSPLIIYRQHAGNDTGAKRFSYLAVLKKAFDLFVKKDIYHNHLDRNIAQANAILKIHNEKLDDSSKVIINGFCNIKIMPFFKKRIFVIRHRLLKQGMLRNIGYLLRI